MKFIEKIDENEYEDFMCKNKDKTHFLQSLEWMKVSEYKGLKTHLVGVKEHNKLVATALLLQKQLPLGFSYFYIPKGFTMDYTNYDLLTYFTKEIDNYTKKFKSLYIKIDPDLKLHNIDHNNKVLEGKNNYELVSFMEKLGYKHLGYNKFFEHSNPRYTFRIDLTSDPETIKSRFHQSSRQRIKKAEIFGINVYIGNDDDVKKFYELMRSTEKKKDFYSHNLEFYEFFYKTFKKNNHVTLYIAEINIDTTIKKIDEEIEKLNNELNNENNLTKNQKQTLIKQIEGFEKSKEEFKVTKEEMGNDIVLSSYMIVNYGEKCWTLYSCNEPKVRNAFGNYMIYNTQVIDAHNKGFKIFDAFGTIGDPKTDNHLLGLHEFKKKFGGEYIEFIGEFDYIQKKLLYLIFTKLVPYYRKFMNKRFKKQNLE